MKKIIILLVLFITSCQINKQEIMLNRDYSNARFDAVYDVQILGFAFVKENYLTGKLLCIRYKNISNENIKQIRFKWTTENGVESGILNKNIKQGGNGTVYFKLVGMDILSVKNIFVADVIKNN